jgi:hypothetical protein
MHHCVKNVLTTLTSAFKFWFVLLNILNVFVEGLIFLFISSTRRTFRHLCRIPGIILLLGRLTSQYDLDGLLKAWVQRLIPSAVKYGDSGGDISACSSGSDGGEDEIITGKPPYPTLLHGVLTEVTFCSERILRDVIQWVQTLLAVKWTKSIFLSHYFA